MSDPEQLPQDWQVATDFNTTARIALLGRTKEIALQGVERINHTSPGDFLGAAAASAQGLEEMQATIPPNPGRAVLDALQPQINEAKALANMPPSAERDRRVAEFSRVAPACVNMLGKAIIIDANSTAQTAVVNFGAERAAAFLPVEARGNHELAATYRLREAPDLAALCDLTQ